MMLQKTKVEECFSKCTEAYDFIRKYKYFKKRFSVTENKEVLEALQIIENVNILGAVSILIHCEGNLVNEYLPLFIERNMQNICDNIRVDSNNIVYFMQVSYLCMMGLEENACVEFAKKIFSGSIYKRVFPEEFENENHDYVTRHYVNVFLSAVTKFDANILWREHYCKIVKAIFEARDRDVNWLSGIEIGLRKNQFGYVIDGDTARDYFDFLCRYEQFQSAKNFLDNFDGSQSYLGLTEKEMVELVYSLPSAELLAFGKWLSKEKLDPNYTYEKWQCDVKKYNQNTDILDWLELTVYYHSLQDSLENNDYQLFNELLSNADEHKMFDMEKVKYMKQLVECFAYIINRVLVDEEKDVVEVLHGLEKININEYLRTRYLGQWNLLESINEEYDYNNIQQILFEKYTLEDVVYIYMNSHLKSIINLEEFVKKCSEKCGEDVSDIFKNYPLWGQISNVSKMSSVRDKLFITPIGMATEAPYSKYIYICDTYGNDSKQAISFRKEMIRSDQAWYSSNKKVAELFRSGDYCTFYIKAYKKDEGILAYNLDLYPDVKEKRIAERNEVYPVKVLNWLEEIQKSRKFIDWNENDCIFGTRNVSSTEKRNAIAIAILKTAYVLQNNEKELRRFMFSIANPPVEEINEFRYIPTQRWLHFEFDRESFSSVKKNIIEMMKGLMSNDSIPSDLKKNIYLNTCARKYYDLYEVCKKIPNEFYLETAEEPFVIWIKLEESVKAGNKMIFSTRGKNNTLFSIKNFVYYGEISGLQPNNIYLVELKEYDYSEGCFVLNRININKKETEQWKKYLRKMRDIKSAVEGKDFDVIANDIKKYKVKVSSKEHIRQWVHEIDLIFGRQKYSVEKAIQTINTLRDTNPFLNRTIDWTEYAEEFKASYMNTYEAFLNDYKEEYKSQMGMCDFFFSSYLQVFIAFEKFLDDIAEDENGRNGIVQYCKYKEYIV